MLALPRFTGAALLVVAACSAAGDGGSSGGGAGSGIGGDLGLDAGSVDDEILKSAPPCAVTDANADADGDGFSIAQGDCNDCTRQMNPGAFDYPGNGVDEDCNGAADDAPTGCDADLATDSLTAADAARAVGLCQLQSGQRWGLVSARWITADDQPLEAYDPAGLGHGILAGFGEVHPQEGAKLLALSSGTARQPDDTGYQSVAGYDKGYTTDAPPGFPKESPSCPGATTGAPHDSVALALKVKVPSNARSLSFDLDFYTYEFPDFVCTEFNDFFVALLAPPPPTLPDGNISFDAQGNLISVNASFLQVCKPQSSKGKAFACPLGPAQLAGTGFDRDYFGSPTDGSAATGWLETTAPVEPGSTIELRLALWDSGDGMLDSTVLVDHFRWGAQRLDATTSPIGVPK